MLELQPLHHSQYRQVAEWDEQRPLGDDIDWERYYAEMNAPKWAHFGIYDADSFVGCVSFERVDRLQVAYHVVTARRRVKPDDLAALLLETAENLFNEGVAALTVRIPSTNRAAARLAIRCGMAETSQYKSQRRFILTRQVQNNGIV